MSWCKHYVAGLEAGYTRADEIERIRFEHICT